MLSKKNTNDFCCLPSLVCLVVRHLCRSLIHIPVFTSKKTTAANPAERRANPMPSDDDNVSEGEVPFVGVGLKDNLK